MLRKLKKNKNQWVLRNPPFIKKKSEQKKKAKKKKDKKHYDKVK